MVPPASHKVSRVSWYSGSCCACRSSRTRLLRSLVPAFHPVIPLIFRSLLQSATPSYPRVVRFGLFRFRSPLLAESLLISLPGATEMFQFTPSPPRTLCIHVRVTRHLPWPGFPIRTSAGLRIFAPYRSFSQLVTSFFGYRCQGIHPALFVT